MRTTEEILEKLAIHCNTRGAAAQLSRDLNVAKSTVTRWQEEKTIPEAMQKLLVWYLFGEAPPSFSRKINLRDALVFEEEEWRIIAYLAKRAGITEAAWIVRHVKDYLSILNQKQTTEKDAPPVLRIAETVTEYKVPPKPDLPAPYEMPLLRAAAGAPILGDEEMVEVERDYGHGRFLLELRGESMAPRFQDRQRIVMRHKSSLRRPVLKYGELYAFVVDGLVTFKQWAKDKQTGERVLRSLNPEHADLIADETTDWIGWVDPADNA